MSSNADKLAEVLSYWARPALAQLATSKIMQLPAMKSAEAALMASGLVGDGYSLVKDLEPFVAPVLDVLVTPMMSKCLVGVPDETVPALANAIVDKMKEHGSLSLLDGLVTFEESDIKELAELVTKNLPMVSDGEHYELIK